MKVRELIEELRKYDLESVVLIHEDVPDDYVEKDIDYITECDLVNGKKQVEIYSYLKED